MPQEQNPASKNATSAFKAVAIAALIVGAAANIEQRYFLQPSEDHVFLNSRATAAQQDACQAHADKMNGAMVQAGLGVSRVHNQHVYDHCLRQKLG